MDTTPAQSQTTLGQSADELRYNAPASGESEQLPLRSLPDWLGGGTLIKRHDHIRAQYILNLD